MHSFTDLVFKLSMSKLKGEIFSKIEKLNAIEAGVLQADQIQENYSVLFHDYSNSEVGSFEINNEEEEETDIEDIPMPVEDFCNIIGESSAVDKSHLIEEKESDMELISSSNIIISKDFNIDFHIPQQSQINALSFVPTSVSKKKRKI